MATQICHLTQFFQERNLLSHNLSFKISPHRIKTGETLNLILYKKFLIGNPKKQLGDLYFTFISSNIFLIRSCSIGLTEHVFIQTMFKIFVRKIGKFHFLKYYPPKMKVTYVVIIIVYVSYAT